LIGAPSGLARGPEAAEVLKRGCPSASQTAHFVATLRRIARRMCPIVAAYHPLPASFLNHIMCCWVILCSDGSGIASVGFQKEDDGCVFHRTAFIGRTPYRPNGLV